MSSTPSLTPGLLFSLAMAIAWLLPNHYMPWPAFHSDFAAAIALALASWVAWARQTEVRVPMAPPATLAFAMALVPLLQLAFGRIHFAGDAWMAALYLSGAGIAAQLGHTLRRHDASVTQNIAWAVVGAAIICVGLALAQWFELRGLGVFVENLAPGGRAYANFGQPNQLATLLVLGLVAALWMFELQRIGRGPLWTIAAFLGIGIALTQSRAGYLEVLGLVLWLLFLRRRAGLRATPVDALAIGLSVLLAAAVVTLSTGSNASDIRTVDQTLSAGQRPLHWAALIDAIGRSPWWGYGWNQVSVAIAGVANDHPYTGEMIEHSHNIVLDLLVWNGAVLGSVIVLVAAVWMVRHIRQCRDAESSYLIASLGALLVHAMLELPLEYAYFLLPAAFMAGALAARSSEGRSIVVPRAAWALVLAAATLLTSLVGVEYMRFEEDHRQLRFQSAGIGADGISPHSPPAHLLTQLLAFNRFARTEARRSMSDDELTFMHKVAERYGYPPVLFRYAIAAGINGRPQDAEVALMRMCKIHRGGMCQEGRDNWRLISQGKYPELQAVRYPPGPH